MTGPDKATRGIAGVILAGGRATRMGGGDKGLRPLAGRRVIDHVIARLAGQVGALALNANGDPVRFADLGLPVLPDPMPDHPGPLAGVLGGMDWAAAQGFSAVVTVAADTPFFPRDLVAGLVANAGPGRLCLAASRDADGRVWRQPIFGLWPVSLRDDLQAALAGGTRKVGDWANRHGAGTAIFAGEDAFFNINTPEDLAEAEQRAGRIA